MPWHFAPRVIRARPSGRGRTHVAQLVQHHDVHGVQVKRQLHVLVAAPVGGRGVLVPRSGHFFDAAAISEGAGMMWTKVEGVGVELAVGGK